MNIYSFNLNGFCLFTVIKNKNITYIFIVNNNSYLLVPFTKSFSDFHLDDNSKTLNIKQPLNLVLKKTEIITNFKIKNIFIVFFFKIKFVGKGFRLQSFKNKRVMNFTFGHSHKMYMKFPLFFFKRISKYKYFFKSKNLDLINFLKTLLKTIKPINKYTLRGLRITRTLITKRKGRKSPTL